MQTDRNVVVPLQRRVDDREREPERFVDSSVAAKFLSIERKYLLLLARKGKIPAYPLGDGQRRLWRFRLSELARAMEELARGKNEGTASAKKAQSIR
jgi:excisionase family DNA binding protein